MTIFQTVTGYWSYYSLVVTNHSTVKLHIHCFNVNPKDTSDPFKEFLDIKNEIRWPGKVFVVVQVVGQDEALGHTGNCELQLRLMHAHQRWIEMKITLHLSKWNKTPSVLPCRWMCMQLNKQTLAMEAPRPQSPPRTHRSESSIFPVDLRYAFRAKPPSKAAYTSAKLRKFRAVFSLLGKAMMWPMSCRTLPSDPWAFCVKVCLLSKAVLLLMPTTKQEVTTTQAVLT